jgi:hypothetical protein
MRTLWQPETRKELLARLARLTPADTPQWGTMTAAAMLAHLADTTRMGIGDLPVAPRRLPLRYFPLKQLFAFWLPIPRHVPTMPELRSRQPGAWDAEMATVRALLEHFAQLDPAAAWPAHPAFGPLTGKQWGRLGYRHFDHHLRQFGV